MASQPVMLRLARPIGSSARRQVHARYSIAQRRNFAEKKDSILSSDPTFERKAAPLKTEVPLGPGGPGQPAPKAPTPATPSSTSTIPPQNVPLAPPNPPKVVVPPPPTSPPKVTAPPPPPSASVAPVAAPKRRFSFLRVLLYLIITGAIGYGGAIFYALRSDNFHDFFTEYVPLGEDAVLYFEERSFQKRFPNARSNNARAQTTRANDDSRVTIPWKSGLSWKVSEEGDAKGTDVSQKGKHMNALDANNAKPAAPKTAEPQMKADPAPAQPVPVVAKQAKTAPAADPKAIPPAADKKTKAAEGVPVASKSDTRPPVIAPVTAISNLQIPNADEPVVQELVKIVNDLITVVNADSADAANKYSAPMAKAKESLASVASKISTLRDAERKAAEERVQEAHKEFDEGAKQLLQRIETAQHEDDARYREEFETERAKLAQSYEDRLKTEADRSTQLAEQRLKNELTEQAIEMQRKFQSDIQSLVESERDGRLSKLSDLSTNVDKLTELTSNWNGIIDSNLATQKLQVAVDAVRSALAPAATLETKPKPFVREMAALKLVADGDAIVDAAIASINPAAYQRGIPSQPMLIDRFRRVASEVRKASLLPEDAGVASHVASFILSRVMFKKHGQPQGGDVESILTRTETLLEEGDLDAAAREMNGLQGWAKVLSRDWMGDVRKVLEVKQALEVIETEARLQCLRVE